MLTDLHHAWRALSRAPLLAIVIVSAVAVGVGVNTVVFSWMQAFVSRPIPAVADASRFHLIETRGEGGVRPGLSWPEFLDLRDAVTALHGMTAFRMVPLNVGAPPQTERVSALLVAGNYFDTLGVHAAAGRLLQEADAEAPGRGPVAIVSHDYWRTRLGGTPDAINRTLRVNDIELTIVGVAPEGFLGTVLGLQFDLWVPATMAPALLGGSAELDDRSLRGYYVMAQLASGRSMADAQAQLAQTMARLGRDFPATNTGLAAEVLPFWRASRGPQGLLLEAIAVLQGIMLVLLLAVCGNTANLLLARASTRGNEAAVRLAVGASRWRVTRLLLIESALLGLSGAVAGVLLAWWGSTALRAVPFTTQFTVRFHTEIAAAEWLFALGLGLACTLAFGLAPALQLARVTPHAASRYGAGGASGRVLRRSLMAAQTALAMMVLIAAALFLRSMWETRTIDPGFRTAGVLITAYDPGRPVDGPRSRSFAADVLDTLLTRPEVERAAIAASLPLDIHGLPVRSFVVEGRVREDGGRDRARSNIVTPGYFGTLDIPLLAGRDFTPLRDTVAPPEVIVNEAFAARFFDGVEPLGRRLFFGDRAFTVIGITRTTLSDSFSEPPTPALYLSYRDWPLRAGEIHVRTRLADERLLTAAVREAVVSLDPGMALYNVRTMAEHIDMNLALRKIPARMFAVLGPLMLLLAAVGIYAVVSYAVARRTSEIGVRMTLGASGSRVRREVIGDALRIVLAGAVIGWMPAAYLYTHLMRGRLDAATFAGVPLLLIAVAVAACWMPARRASRVDPAVALRSL